MYTGNIYRAKDMARWTRFETMRFVGYIIIWVALYYFVDLNWLRIPWTPMALIGTAVAFVIGFQNNAVYGRIWEARKIWGGIVNTSRTFGVYVQAMLSDEHMHHAANSEEIKNEMTVLTYRHIAWMTALRHAMRAERSWEVTSKQRSNTDWGVLPPEKKSDLKEDLKPYISDFELEYVMSKDNKQTAILYLQSGHLKKLKEQGMIWEFSFLELEGVIKDLFTLQGQSERIKNFPYPRQYATLNHFFMWILLFILPLALVPQFADIGSEISQVKPFWGNLFVWLSVPMYVAVAWIFHTMERIGRTGENPFEGTANDVPISAISRGIENDLRQNLGDSKEDIPGPFPMEYDVQF